MQIKQFEDKHLSHFSYAILSECENKVILIDPARDPLQYINYAKQNGAQITAVIETHPHADFVSCHLELQQQWGVIIYASKKVHALYPHQSFDDGDWLQMGKIKLRAINTPGHSPDSICVLLEHDGIQKAVFTGDTLFIGDCGRPDLRPGTGDATVAAQQLAAEMYHSLREKLMLLPNNTIIYPAHGAGTLCGKALSANSSSTMGEEKRTNWSLQSQTEKDFIQELLRDQPFVPAYFPFDVTVNKRGAPGFGKSISAVVISAPVTYKKGAQQSQVNTWIIDTRNEAVYKKAHLHYSINLMLENKFETWLGTMIKPGEHFYLAGENEKSIHEAIRRSAAIGYEQQIVSAFIVNDAGTVRDDNFDTNYFSSHPSEYTIIDVRNNAEVKEKQIFEDGLSIPLGKLRENIGSIPVDKPIVVHCAGGFRSAAGSSLIDSVLGGRVKVFDLGKAISNFL